MEKPKKRDVYVTNWDRAAAEQPKALSTWIYQPFDKKKVGRKLRQGSEILLDCCVPIRKPQLKLQLGMTILSKVTKL